MAGALPAPFDLRFETDGEMRYVDNSKVEGLGYVGYSVTHLTWQTDEELVEPTVAEPLTANGVYVNQETNVGSSWRLARSRNRREVTGRFSCNASPVEYQANNPEGRLRPILRVPAEYWPAADVPIQVTGAIRVNDEGVYSTDLRRVDFGLTVQPNGEMWYDPDPSLHAEGVGHLRYAVDVAWTAVVLVPSAPLELAADDIEATEVELDWEVPAYSGGDFITTFRVEVWDSEDEEWDTVAADIRVYPYTVEHLDPYTVYSFRVAARNSAGWGEPGPAITVTTPRQAPGTPGRPTATATHERVNLTWTAPTTEGDVTGYRVERRRGSSGSWQTRALDTGETAPGWVDLTVAAATRYSYRVAAHNHGEPGAWSSTRSVTTAAAPTLPGSPTGLTVAPGTASRLQLTWTAPSDTGGGVTGYQVERSPDETPRVWAVIQADTGSSALSWGDDDVAADTVYAYRVRAQNSAGVGPASPEAQRRARPQLTLGGLLPYPLTAHAEPRASAPVTATFAVYLPGRVYDLVAQVPGAEGWWRVLLFGQSAQGPFWLPAAAGTALGNTTALPQPPAAPASFTAALASGEVTLTWTAPPAGSAVTGYRLWRQTDAGIFAQLGSDLAATVLTQTDSTVQNGHVYRYWLQGLSAEGPGVPSGRAALAVMATPAAPAAVTSLNVAATTTTLELTWVRATTGGLATGYRVGWRLTGTAAAYQTVAVTGLTHTLRELSPGKGYALQVTAFNQEGDAPVTSGTGTTVQVPPGVPTGLTVAPTPDSQLTLSWAAPLDTGTHALAGYRIERSPDMEPRVWGEVVADTATPALSWADRGLTADTVYHYRVSARSGAGVGASSTAATGQTRPQLTLSASATFPLTAHVWPAVTAPVTHTWDSHEAAPLDIGGQISGAAGWWRVLRFGAADGGTYWLPKAAGTSTGATPNVPQAPGPTGAARGYSGLQHSDPELDRAHHGGRRHWLPPVAADRGGEPSWSRRTPWPRTPSRTAIAAWRAKPRSSTGCRRGRRAAAVYPRPPWP